ncbi:MAG: T9SS type A sorting domain-containing protein, partial [Saprospiraceae bacterium]|nr:T9SS type A sorting domain-containing protein [Saprospiraceae bacterium]
GDDCPKRGVIDLVKTADKVAIFNQDELVTYSFKVTNPGKVPIAEVVLTDDHCGPVSPPLGDDNLNDLLDPGEIWTYTCSQTYTYVEGEVIVNVAEVKGKDPTGMIIEDRDSAILLTVGANMEIIAPAAACPGDQITVELYSRLQINCEVLSNLNGQAIWDEFAVKADEFNGGTWQMTGSSLAAETPFEDIGNDNKITCLGPVAENRSAAQGSNNQYPTWKFTYTFVVPVTASGNLTLTARDKGESTVTIFEQSSSGPIMGNDEISISINLTPCIVLPSRPTCDLGFLLWENSVTVNPDGSISTPLRFESGGTVMYEIFNTATLPPAFAGPVLIQINEVVAWDGYVDRRMEPDEPNERFRVIGKKNGNIVFMSPWSGIDENNDGLATGALSDDWISAQGWSGPLTDVQSGIDQILLVHWSAPVDMGGSPNPGQESNSMVPVSVCIRYEEALLPIELLSFSALPSDESSVIVEWSTASEANSNHFEIERSPDELSFQMIARANAAGYSSTQVDYNHVDETPYRGANYYRLKAVDYDGSYTYSKVVVVENTTLPISSIQVFPNPARSVLYLEIANPNDEMSSVEVVDFLGRRIKEFKPGGNLLYPHRRSIDVSDLVSGSYLLRVKSDHFTHVRTFEVVN